MCVFGKTYKGDMLECSTRKDTTRPSGKPRHKYKEQSSENGEDHCMSSSALFSAKGGGEGGEVVAGEIAEDGGDGVGNDALFKPGPHRLLMDNKESLYTTIIMKGMPPSHRVSSRGPFRLQKPSHADALGQEEKRYTNRI